jgi:hypothetical protein
MLLHLGDYALFPSSDKAVPTQRDQLDKASHYFLCVFRITIMVTGPFLYFT